MPLLFAYGINRFSHDVAQITSEPLYNMVHYDMVLDIIRSRVGPQMAI